jgi:3-phosphoshikimate 1-carboxyvinyltransferase
MEPLIDILSQLRIVAKQDKQSLVIESQGWELPDAVNLDLSKSSQFASGFLLCCWNLDKKIKIHFSKTRVSDGYLEMTLKLLNSIGFQIDVVENGLIIHSHQTPKAQNLIIEQDLSSAFVVASLAAVRGFCRLEPFDRNSSQPDVAFLEIFERIGIPIEYHNQSLIVHRSAVWNPIRISLRNSPDLFPVLCILLSKCEGESEVYDTPQLIFKESNRLQKTSELLKLMRVSHQILENGIRIKGKKYHHHEYFQFQPDHDHRLAFAAAVAKSMGYRMRILNPEVVNKSFPGFWNLITGGAGL